MALSSRRLLQEKKMGPLSARALALGLAVAICPLLAPAPISAAPRAKAVVAPVDPLAHDLFKELIEINTTDSTGNVTTAAEAVRKRFLEAGFPESDLALLGPNDRKKNLVVRFHGSGRHKPILLMGHLDVVEARRDDWSTDPFKLTEQGDYFTGRGTLDMKSNDAIMAATLIRLRKEHFQPSRDIILALTADEEGGSSNGVDWLLRNHRDLIDAEYVINPDTNSVISDNGVPQFFEVDATEKVYADYQLTVTNPGGHSSIPKPDNAIYILAEGLTRLEHFQFPFELNNVTRGFYERMATIETGQRQADMRAILQATPDKQAITRLSRDPRDNANLRTTCVATRLEAGHANNALPQRAQAVVNCRILPGHSLEEVRQGLIAVLGNANIVVRYLAIDGKVADKAPAETGLPPQPLDPEVIGVLQKTVDSVWPKLIVIPTMDRGASDGVYTEPAGMPTYEFDGVAIDRENDGRHGRDERVGIQAFYTANEFFYRLIKALTNR
jgi:acetylornithine deacetylase/succinyl-diaminopimelate desuccinylase-like protein